MTATTTKTYEVNADGNLSHRTESQAVAARVAVRWAKSGLRPHLYVIGRDAEDRITTDRVEIGRTVAETRAALAAATA